MNTSVMKALGSSLLALAFIVSPVAPAFDEINVGKFATVKTAEAKAISYGSISGIVHQASSTTPVEGVTINLFLANSNSLAQSVKTDANGMFNFVAIAEEGYKVALAPMDGYISPKNALTSVEIKSLVNSFSTISFEVVELPFIKMFGGNEVTVVKDSVFNDPGVIFQKKDGTIVTGYAITSSGKVDTSKVGKYTITYSIDKDATAGYQVANIVRTVNVIEKKVGGLTVLPVVSATTKSVSTATAANKNYYLNSYLGKSFSNDKLEVIKLQAFLAFKEGNKTVKATGVFDAATEVAVRNFQDKYFVDILLPYGTEDNTGEVRMLTLKKINDLMSGTSTALTLEQKNTLTAFKNSSNVSSHKVAIDVKEVPFVIPEEKSISSKISSWWSGVKKSLVAVLPFGHKDEEKMNFTASGTVAVSDVSATGTDNMASAKAVKESSFSVVATIVSAILGLAAFVLAFYIYKKTRGPVLAEAVIEGKKGDKKK